MKIDGMAAMVTGGASGLGAATARRLAACGARVTIFDRDVEKGEATAREVAGAVVAVDVTNENDVERGLDIADAAHGKARILVNWSGMGPPGKAIGRDGKALPLADFARIVNVNLLGTFNVLSKFAARVHTEPPVGEERAVIIITASVAAFDGQIGQPAYAASKGGLVGMTLPLAREFARHGIRVVTSAPGIFLTPLLASLPQDAQDSLGHQVPFPSRLGKPEEFAVLVEAITGNPMLNGETIRLDGAIRMAPR